MDPTPAFAAKAAKAGMVIINFIVFYFEVSK